MIKALRNVTEKSFFKRPETEKNKWPEHLKNTTICGITLKSSTVYSV